ncbi:MAG: hypothetical protein ABW123_01055 [Cystobacter sp.]
MAVSPLNRSSYYPPLSYTTPVEEKYSAPLQPGVPLQPSNPILEQLMTDLFEPVSGSSNGNPLTEALGQLMQVMEDFQAELRGEGAPPELGPESFNTEPAANPATSQATNGKRNVSGLPENVPSYQSDAGPGFGPPSANATQQADQPWLNLNNVGSPYNSNMQLIDSSQKDQFKYTNTFTNSTNEPQTITLWNKTGENGMPNDGQNFDKSTPVSFTLQPGESQIVAFDSNTSVAWCASKDGSASPGANSGQTWGEATFANSGTGWSGYDTSQISPAGHNGRMSITNDATGHTVTEANAWQTPEDDPAGLDVGVPAGPLSLTTVLG